MRFSDFLLVSDPGDLDFIVGYTEEQNIRISVSDIFGGYIKGSGNAGYVPVFTSNDSIGNSQIFQDGSNIVIGGVNAMGYRLAVGGTIYAVNGAVIETTSLGADALRVISEGENIFVIPNDLGQSITSSRRIIHPPAVLTTESATLGQLNAAISNLDNQIDILLDLKVDKTSVGVANGVASLDAGGKVPLSQIPDSIIGQVQYMGTWNAFTNTPTLNPLVPEEKGHYYVVSVAGVFGGVDYAVGDWIISNGVIWEKVDNTDAVTSVFGRIGAILAIEADYQSFYPRLSQAYDNPTWINSLAFTKITGVPPFLLENQTITLSGDVTGSGKTSISTTISNNAVSNEKLRDSVGTSVIGRSVFSTGDPADIQANSDGHVLLRSAGNLLFGLISSDSISSINWSKITGTPTTLSGYGITDAYTKTEADNKFVPYTGASANVNLGSNNINANSFIKAGGTSSQFLKADGSVDASQYVPTTRSINAGTGLTGGGNLSSDVNISFDTTWGDIRYAYRTRQLTINGTTYDLSADRTWNVGTVTSVGLSMPSAFTVSNSPVNGSGTLTVVGAGTTADYIRGDGSLATFPSLAGYVPYTGATQDVNLGTYGLTSDFVRFNTTNTSIPSAEGVMWWDSVDGTVRLSVQGNIYSVPIGQSIISKVRNNTNVNLLRTNYQVVKISGAQGQRLAVTLAQANNDLNSVSTLGLVCENIFKNQEGFVINIGQITNINTTGSLQGETWNDGDVIYLSPTIAGAVTNVKPIAPQHTVILGYVEYAHANNGKIYVKIDNGYELEELHDVSAEPFVNNGLLYRDTTLNLWKSATISTILGYTPAPQGNYITALTGEVTASGPGSVTATLSNSAVTGKVLTGLNIAGNAILSTDSILTAFGKLQHQVNQLVGGLQYEGTWNASTNTPTITSSVGTDGTFYIVNVAGTTNINGINDWEVGDWIVFHDTAWQKVDNSDSVSSVFGRVGNIVANQSDYSAFYPLIADIKNGVLTVQGTGVLSGSGTFSANQATNNTISLVHNSVTRTDTTSTQTPSFGGSFTAIDGVTSSAEGHVTAINLKTVTIPSTVATATQTGLLSNADWITFNGKQNVITLTTTGTSGAATLVGSTLNIPNYTPDLSGYITLATDQTITGLKTIVRGGDVLNFKIGTDTLYGLKVAYNQNELVPSGEATWSFVNTFNRNGSGFETTPISFFRGVLVTGERLLSASINSNLLDYYSNNPSGRYPVYAYNTGVQQFSTGIIVGKTTGVVNAATGAISDLPSGVVANFNGRVIGSNAVNSNEFVALGQLGSYVPTSRTLTINGVTFDLSANRSWTITAGVSSVTASSPLFSSGGATPNITIQQATASQNGFLSNSDWTTFNSKANANGSNASGTWGISITGNAETVDGFSASTSTLGNHIVVRDASGYIFGNYINMSDDGNPGAGTSITSFITKQGDNYYRSVSPTNAMSSIRSVASGSWGINITGSAGSASTASLVNGTSGGAIQSWDIRTISPSSMTAARLGFGFTSWSNNNTGPYADYLHLRSYSDGSGGADNLVMFLKSGIGMRIYQQAFGSASVYSSFADVLLSTNFSSYALPLTGGTLSGPLTINGNDNQLVINGSTGALVAGMFFREAGTNKWELYHYNGSFRFYNYSSGSEELSISNSGGFVTARTSFRAPIFYDSDNTAYYVNPNSDTNLYGTLQVSGGHGNSQIGVRLLASENGGGGGQINLRMWCSEPGVTWNWGGFGYNVTNDGGSPGGFGRLNTSHGQAYMRFSDTGDWYFYNTNTSGTRTQSLQFTSAGAAIFGSAITTTNVNAPSGYTSFGNPWGTANSAFFPNGITTAGSTNWIYGSNTYIGNAPSNGAGHEFFASGSSNSTGDVSAFSSMRAPIFYDRNNTAYYGDFATTSRMNSILLDSPSTTGGVTALTFAPISTEYADAGYVNRWYPMTYQRARYGDGYVTHLNTGLYKTTSGWGAGQNGWYAAIGGSDASPTEEWRLTYGGELRHSYGYVTIAGSARSPIFYDSDNTAYYINAASGSSLNWLTINDWYYVAAATGLYWNAYSRAIASPEYTGNAYGTVATVGSRNGWAGYGIGSRHVFMSTGGDNVGVHDNSRGWIWYWNGSFTSFDFGYLQAAGSMRAPIFYDSNNTGYYVDPSGGSYFAGSLEIANGYVLTNGIGGSMYMTSVSGSFGGYLRTSGHMVLDQMNAGYNVYVLDGNSVGVVKNAGSQSWSAFSDRTIKTIHSLMEDNLSKLESISPIYYSFNNFADDKNRIGLIAQEVQEHFPELVEVEPMTEKLVLDYTGLIPVLLGAIKELKKEIDTLKAN